MFCQMQMQIQWHSGTRLNCQDRSKHYLMQIIILVRFHLAFSVSILILSCYFVTHLTNKIQHLVTGHTTKNMMGGVSDKNGTLVQEILMKVTLIMSTVWTNCTSMFVLQENLVSEYTQQPPTLIHQPQVMMLYQQLFYLEALLH